MDFDKHVRKHGHGLTPFNHADRGLQAFEKFLARKFDCHGLAVSDRDSNINLMSFWMIVISAVDKFVRRAFFLCQQYLEHT